ncbi:hypothetical protein EDB85DRAFT_1625786 [Lactarius pseudohatsudake]|nr:hypothetical protein EDB85DRAFT_1625786 [Lactarius pseudohatsudake]
MLTRDVYEQVFGRTSETGYTVLTWGAKSPLRQFNCMIDTLQRCCSIQPLVGTTFPAKMHAQVRYLPSNASATHDQALSLCRLPLPAPTIPCNCSTREDAEMTSCASAQGSRYVLFLFSFLVSSCFSPMSLTALVWASSSMTPSQHVPAAPHPYRRHFKPVPAAFTLRHTGVRRRHHPFTARKTRHNATPRDAITTWRCKHPRRHTESRRNINSTRRTSPATMPVANDDDG